MKRSHDRERRQSLEDDLVNALAQQAIKGETDWRRHHDRRPGDACKWGQAA